MLQRTDQIHPIAATRDQLASVLLCIVSERHDGRKPARLLRSGRRRCPLPPLGERGRRPHARALRALDADLIDSTLSPRTAMCLSAPPTGLWSNFCVTDSRAATLRALWAATGRWEASHSRSPTERSIIVSPALRRRVALGQCRVICLDTDAGGPSAL